MGTSLLGDFDATAASRSGANYIAAPPGSQFVYWQMAASSRSVRIGKDRSPEVRVRRREVTRASYFSQM